MVRRLQVALDSGQSKTYGELAAAASCSERTVRNYLNQAEQALGFEISRKRGDDGHVRVCRVSDGADSPTMEEIGQILARDLLRRVFPLAGTNLDRAPRRRGPPIVIVARGAYRYEERHMRALRTWLQAAAATPRLPLRFRYDAASSGSGERIVWPVGAVLRGLTRVYLAGIPAEALSSRDVRTYALEWICFPRSAKALQRVPPAEAASPPDGIDQVGVDDAIDAPFGIFCPKSESSVTVRARFPPATARYVIDREWHQNQRTKRHRDGSFEVEFGPAHIREAAEWAREWGSGIDVLGDDALLRHLEGDLVPTLQRLRGRLRPRSRAKGSRRRAAST